MANVSIVTQYGSRLLLQRRGRLAIVERRDNRIYPVDDEESEGFPDTTQGLLDAVGQEGWGDPETVRAQFEEITAEGETLAQKMR